MPAALKHILRPTLVVSTMNPPPFLSPSCLHTNCTSRNAFFVRRGGVGGCRIAKEVVSLRVVWGAQVNTQNIRTLFTNNNKTPPNKNIIIISSTNNKLYMLSSHSQHHNNNNSSSSSSPSSSTPSPPFQERETSLPFSSSTSSSLNPLVADMGHGDNEPNGAELRQRQNGPLWKDQRKGREEVQCTKLLTLPTLLTLARVAAIPVFIATFYVDSWWGTAATTSIFVAAAITDWLDGYLARKMCQGTAFGAFLDPVADKLMVAATLVLLCSRPPETALLGNMSWLFPVPAIAIIGREITMSAVREWAASQNAQLLQAVAVNNLGKWKTATQMIALTILVATRDSSLAGSGAVVASGVALLYVSAGLAVWSLVVYTRKIWKVLLRQ